MKTYALVGSGSRGLYSYAVPLAEKYRDIARLAAIYDINPLKAEYARSVCGCGKVYTDFDEMMKSERPDTVIITTVDRFHDEYILRTLEYGADVICEKPLTTDAEKAKAIIKAQKKYNNNIAVTFNVRFTPYIVKLRELIRDGAVGDVISVSMEWLLDRSHGADYFRRWHSKLSNCGGLLVHKSTHHFDLVNFVIDDVPDTVFANGKLRVYGKNGQKRGIRCSTCQYASDCEYFVDMKSDEILQKLYFDTESGDGYMRDRCVYSEDIDIYDTMSLAVTYESGALFTYSLNAHCLYEGWRLCINGTDGRLEAEQISSGPLASHDSDTIRVFGRNGALTEHKVPRLAGAHGGSDDLMRDMLFRPGESEKDTLGQMAGIEAGINSIMTGVCANMSIADGKVHSIKEELK
ncbi:MAG: Gfo/Idh/MocA family oxidoreductase [Clostridiales bacterium]|jgi:predicted dehydrogenase|nr:Gfo/Idh/MocA family oxidoreductase [Clostridiales bacterium]